MRALKIMALLLIGCGTQVIDFGETPQATAPTSDASVAQTRVCSFERQPGPNCRCGDQVGNHIECSEAFRVAPCSIERTPDGGVCVSCPSNEGGAPVRTCLRCGEGSRERPDLTCHICAWDDLVDMPCLRCLDDRGYAAREQCLDMRRVLRERPDARL